MVDMSDVPFGEPREDYRPESISRGLLDIADWFDVYDNRLGTPNNVEYRTVQNDLREWADEIKTLQEMARRYDEEHRDDHYDPMG